MAPFVVLDLRFSLATIADPYDLALIFQSIADADVAAREVASGREPVGPWTDVLRAAIWRPQPSYWGPAMLTVARVRYGSPLDIFNTIRWDLVATGAGGGGLTLLLGQIERYWHPAPEDPC